METFKNQTHFCNLRDVPYNGLTLKNGKIFINLSEPIRNLKLWGKKNKENIETFA